MSPLAEVQRAFARAVMTGAPDPTELPAFVGRVPMEAAFRVHRGTVLGGLTNALRLTYPTIDSLVGSEFFDHAAVAFIEGDPPAMANLSAYGDGYPSFLSGFEPVAALPYLSDVAAFDLAIDRVQRAHRRPPRQLPVDVHVALEIPEDLRLLALTYPADAVRAVLDDGDPDALGRLDMGPSHYWVAVWRGDAGARVRRLAGPAGRFLDALLSGASCDDAFAAAAVGAEENDVLAAIKADVFAAPFATIVSRSEPAAS